MNMTEAKNINDLTKEELVEAVLELYTLLEFERNQYRSHINFLLSKAISHKPQIQQKVLH